MYAIRSYYDRQADLLGHTGQRIGGNDFDIRLAVAELMPLCGMNGLNKRGLPMPAPLFWNAMSINDVQAQSRFYSPETARLLQQLMREARITSYNVCYTKLLRWHGYGSW